VTSKFSARSGAGKPKQGLLMEKVPPAVYAGLLNYLQTLPRRTRQGLRSFVCGKLDIYYEPDDAAWGWIDMDNVVEFFNDEIQPKPWHAFYDLCEAIAECHLRNEDENGYQEFEHVLNEILRRNFCGYEMRSHQIETVGSRAAEKVVAEARGILRDNRLQGPNDQFLKALGFLSHQPPDIENSVKEAVGAIEGLLRIAMDEPKVLLSDALKKLASQGKIPPTVKKSIDGIYAFRGDADGVAHGKTGAGEVTVEEAEFVVHCAAAAIVYFAGLYEYTVV
jgi:AbiJ N-terminal domain 4